MRCSPNWALSPLRRTLPTSPCRPSAEKHATEEIANRSRCKDFDRFRPLFEQVQKELDAGLRETHPSSIQADIKPGRFFIIGGQKALVAEMGEEFTQSYGDRDARLRVIFDNGTESNMLRRSLQRALHKDEKGRRILETTAGPLFANVTAYGDEASGTIYVLRSKANIPFVVENLYRFTTCEAMRVQLSCTGEDIP